MNSTSINLLGICDRSREVAPWEILEWKIHIFYYNYVNLYDCYCNNHVTSKPQHFISSSHKIYIISLRDPWHQNHNILQDKQLESLTSSK